MSGSNSSEDLEGGKTLFRNVTPGGHDLDTSQPAFPVYHRKLANPAPLGLCGFALTTFILGLCDLQAAGVTHSNIAVGPAIAYGGLIQLLAGMWEFPIGNTLGATLLSSYGGFWISYALLLSPWSGIAAAYSDKRELEHAIGFYLIGWTIFTCIMFIAALRTSWALLSVFTCLTPALIFLSVASFITDPVIVNGLTRAAGFLAVLTSFLAWYTAATSLLDGSGASPFRLPAGSRIKRD